jgi:hypothetical protein
MSVCRAFSYICFIAGSALVYQFGDADPVDPKDAFILMFTESTQGSTQILCDFAFTDGLVTQGGLTPCVGNGFIRTVCAQWDLLKSTAYRLPVFPRFKYQESNILSACDAFVAILGH